MDVADNARTDAYRPDAPGTALGAARQAQNLSVADVARQLKLSLHQVEALEAGEYGRLPGPVFVRGFIRNYARLLKIDPEQLLHSAADSLPPVEPRPAAPPSQEIPFPTAPRRRWPAYAAAAAVVVAALAVYEFRGSEPEPVAARSAAVPPPAVPAAPAGAPDAVPGTPAGPAGEPGAAPGVAGAPDAPPAAAAGSALADSEAPRAGERQVHMVFDQESWVEIRDRSGRAIFSQLNRRGTEQRVSGRPPLSVIVGNAHGVKLTWDDQPVNLAQHTKIDVARLTLE